MNARLLNAAMLALAACGTGAVHGTTQPPTPRTPARLDFDRSMGGWVIDASSGQATVEAPAAGELTLKLTPGSDGDEIRAERLIDAAPLRGRKVRVETKVTPLGRGAKAALKVALVRPGMHADAWDSIADQSRAEIAGPQDLVAVLDVTQDAVAIRISLVARGKAATSFVAPSIDSLVSGPVVAHALTKDQQDRLFALAQLTGLLRFFHPSDQSANADWTKLEVDAVRRMLDARTDDEARRVLQWLTSTVAPTANIYRDGEAIDATPIPQSATGWFTRWKRIGLGSTGPYYAVRDGLDEPDDLDLELQKVVLLRDVGVCKHATVSAASTIVSGTPQVSLSLTAVRGKEDIDSKSAPLQRTARVDDDVPTSATGLLFAVSISGHGQVDIGRVTLLCDGREVATNADGMATEGKGAGLFAVATDPTCDGGRCMRISRTLPTTTDPKVDVLDQEIGLGLRVRLPLAVWTDGTSTLPKMPAPVIEVDWSARDLPSRVATALDVWISARWSYPYFDDLGIHWNDYFFSSVDATARASSSTDLYDAISRLLAGLRDDHAGIRRPDFDTGVLPFFFRIDGDQMYVAGSLDAYKDILPIGSLIESVDAVPTATVLRNAEARVSAASQGYRNYFTSIALGYGPLGEVVEIEGRDPTGAKKKVAVPRVAFANLLALREKHPADGTQIAPGVRYVDLSTISLANWDALAPTLTDAKVIVFDLRGYISSATFSALGNLTDGELWTPFWDLPVVAPNGNASYVRSQWAILPRAPRLKARIVFMVDGRTVSAAETAMQIIHHYRLGLVVGEPTAGTNGNVVVFTTIGSWLVSFTGMHVLNRDGSLHQGHGIQPDVVVHPTREAVAQGKDEVLEAAIRAAAAN